MFINLSNHPSTKWGDKQMKSAKALSGDGVVVDIPFPNIDPQWSTKELEHCVEAHIEKIESIVDTNAMFSTLHIMGEIGFCMMLAQKITFVRDLARIKVVVSTTDRKVVEDENGVKTSIFEFVQFREI